VEDRGVNPGARPMKKSKKNTENQLKVIENRNISLKLSKYEMPEQGVSPKDTCDIIRSELQTQGNPALNMASFVTTIMDKECDEIIHENLGVNYIDTEVYWGNLEIEERCVKSAARDRLECGLSIVERLDLKTPPAERFTHRIGEAQVIINEENTPAHCLDSLLLWQAGLLWRLRLFDLGLIYV